MAKNNYEIPAKPTKYKGRLYRSRLEARVAAYFDIIGLSFEYEPMDFPKWSPDFLVTHNGYKTLVEVKPENKLFDITKYIDVNFKEFNVFLISPEKTIMLKERGVFSFEHELIHQWTEAANVVMFLKPEGV